MGQDLGFFGIVWGILILGFSTMMLGAEMQSTCPAEKQSDEPLPLWWLLRTYLQSLGSDQLEEMKTPTKIAIFIFMYPIFNVLLVRCNGALLCQ